MFDRLLQERRRVFEHTRNPVWIWVTYRVCRTLQRPIPEWILEQLDTYAIALQGLREKHIDGSQYHAAEVAAAFQFWTMGKNGGPGQNRFERFFAEAEGIELATIVRVLIADGHNPTDACYAAALEYGVSESKARRSFTRHRALVEDGDIEHQRETVEGFRRNQQTLKDFLRLQKLP